MTTAKPISSLRRKFLGFSTSALACFIPGLAPRTTSADESGLYPAVVPGSTLSFPTDHGAHPEYRTEWWYLTASLQSAFGPLGLQVTFFRSRTPYGRDNPSRFAPEQLILAHAALAIPEQGKLLHDQQSFRRQDVVAQYSTADTDVAIGLPNRRWTMVRSASDHYLININTDQFQFSITATPPAAFALPVLQGKSGFSQKGPQIAQASYYYSRPQLRIKGQYQTNDAPVPVTGTGWLDHEWSSELLDEDAAGWDWVGLNFFDGSALMAFQMRTDSGDALYSTARYIAVNKDSLTEHNTSATFTPLRYWPSPRTAARYPVSFRLQTGELDLIIEPLFDDQELDSRASTGVIYWEGTVRVWHAGDVDQNGTKSGKPIASGYLELTGYAGNLSI